MKNKNFLKLKKASDERYFTNYSELFDFILRSMDLTEERFYDMCTKHKSIENEILIPAISKETSRWHIPALGRRMAVMQPASRFDSGAGTKQLTIKPFRSTVNR